MVRVINGDTYVVRTGTTTYRLRLLGVGAPEQGQPFGPQATDSVAQLLAPAPRGPRRVNALKSKTFLAVLIGQSAEVSSTVQALGFGLCPQQIEDEFADNGAIRGDVAGTFAAVVFAKDDVQHPVQAVFDAPMPPHIALKNSSGRPPATQVILDFGRGHAQGV